MRVNLSRGRGNARGFLFPPRVLHGFPHGAKLWRGLGWKRDRTSTPPLCYGRHQTTVARGAARSSLTLHAVALQQLGNTLAHAGGCLLLRHDDSSGVPSIPARRRRRRRLSSAQGPQGLSARTGHRTASARRGRGGSGARGHSQSIVKHSLFRYPDSSLTRLSMERHRAA